MRDRHFMEDENELPYLLWETRDDNRRTSRSYQLELDFEDIPFKEFPSYVKRLVLPQNHKNNIINSVDVEPENCTFSIHQKDQKIYLSLTLKNEYIDSTFYGSYDTYDSEISFNLPSVSYSGLESMHWFKKEVKRVEKEIHLKFDSEGGGYHFKCTDEKLKITDEFQILVYFSNNDGYSDSYSYKVDFNNRKLEKYHVHSWFELAEPWI